MVKQLTIAYKEEITGKIYETLKEAKKAEEKAKKNQIKKFVKHKSEQIAKEFGFESYKTLLEYLDNNIDKIKTPFIKIRTQALIPFTVTQFSLEQIKNVVQPLIQKAIIEIENITSKAIIKLDGKVVEEVDTINPQEIEYKDFNPMKMYLKEEIEDNGNITKEYVSYPENKVTTLYEALTQAKISNYTKFVNAIQDRMVDEQEDLTGEDKYFALVNAGVDNWHGFEYAIELAEENDEDWDDLSPEDKLCYLESAGVDNWHFYSEAVYPIPEFYEASPELIEEVFKEYEEEYSRDWKNYKQMKMILHGLN